MKFDKSTLKAKNEDRDVTEMFNDDGFFYQHRREYVEVNVNRKYELESL